MTFALDLGPVRRDALEPLGFSQAAAMLVEAVEQVNLPFYRAFAPADIHDNHREQFSLAWAVAERMNAYRLRLSLTGEFCKGS